MALVRFLKWIAANAEALVAFILALLAGALGLVGVVSSSVIANATLLVLALLGFALVRDRWKRDVTDDDMQRTMKAAEASFEKLDGRLAMVEQLDSDIRIAKQISDESASIRVLTGAEVSRTLREAMRSTDRWFFKGGTGTYIRAVTLPQCIENARRERRGLTVRLEIIDPTSDMLCTRYSRIRQSLSTEPDGTGSVWTPDRTRKESLAMILAAYWYRERFHLLDIEIGFSSAITTFRYDLSASGLVITQDDPKQPALLIGAGRFFYDCYSTELRNSFEQARRVPFRDAADISLADEPTVNQVKELFASMKLDVPALYGNEDFVEIIQKAVNARNPYQ